MAGSTARPHVIVHMASSLDGRIQTRRWSAVDGDLGYEEVHAALNGDAWMCGRVTMTGYTRGTPEDDTDSTPVDRSDFVAKRDAAGYAVALDFHGRLHWGTRNDIDGDHVVVVVSDRVADAHLNALRTSGVSYVFGGHDQLDLAAVLGKLTQHFGIHRLLVEGGGGINGAFLQAGLVDEISLLLAPAIDGGQGVPAVFDYPVTQGTPPVGQRVTLALTACSVQPNGIVRLRYGVDAAP